MQPHKRKVLIMMAVSAGIIGFSFLIPIVIIPAYLGVSGASNCAISSGCAGDSFSKCGAYQTSSGDSASFTDSLDRGMKGMLCMMGLEGSAKAIVWSEGFSLYVTLNKIPVHIAY